MHSDCIVVGGGVIGLSVARRLAVGGLTVTLLERGRCGAESSWAGAGVLAPCNPHRRDGVSQLRDMSLALYPQFCDDLKNETGIDPEYDACGELEIAINDDSLRSVRENEAAAAGELLPDGQKAYQFHTPEATRSLEPAVSPVILGSLECRRTAQVRNPRLLRALIESCRWHGVHLHEGVAVNGLIKSNSAVGGVLTEQGEFKAGQVVLCAGAWSGQVPGLETLTPVQPVRGQMMLMKFAQRPFQRVIGRGKTYLVPRRDGHVLLGATEEHDGSFSKRNTASGIAGLIQTALKLVPAVADATLITQWAGLRPGTPDDNPYLGPVPGHDGLIAATGHFRAGLILAPITAEIVTAFVQGRPVNVDLAACRPGRHHSR